MVTIVVSVFIQVRNAHTHYIHSISYGDVVVSLFACYVKGPRFDPGSINETIIIYLLTEIERIKYLSCARIELASLG